MTLKEILSLMNEEVYLEVEDADTGQCVEGDCDNSIIQKLDGKVIGINGQSTIMVTVDFKESE